MRVGDIGGVQAATRETVAAVNPPSDYAGDWGAGAGVSSVRSAAAPNASAVRDGDAPARLEAARTHAALADDVYNDTPHPPAGWRVGNDAELAAVGLSGKLMQDGRGFRARLYEGPAGEQVVAFRGSATRQDWKNDFRQAAGLQTSSYARALVIGQEVGASGRASDVVFTGHSLGGGLASAASVASGAPADTFNASGLSGNTLHDAAGLNASGLGGAGRVDAWYVRGEVLSTLQDGGDRVVAGGLGGLIAGPIGGVLGSQVDAPSAYGVRHALEEVPPAGAGFFASHDPVAMHGMPWIERGLDRALAAVK